ncbi:hypothetical protein GCM10025857_68470 [Alicyclobacillus contaminans]|nr:hypothetical protein GCM10025857_68470 [Alicyclobacillus contaminans]
MAKQIGDAYNQEIKSIQSSINSLQTELKKLNPKTQADLVQQVKDKIADLNTELWNTKDALEQINTEAFQSAADTFKSTTDQDLSAMQTAMQNELSAIQQAHQQALAAFDAETKQLEDQIDAQLAALQQTQTQDDRASQQQSWDSQMEDLQHQLAVAQMMNDPRTVKQVQDQIDQLNQQIAAQQRQWAIQDQEQVLQQQKQALDAQREQQRQALDQEWQDREAAFQKQMDQEMQQFRFANSTCAGHIHSAAHQGSGRCSMAAGRKRYRRQATAIADPGPEANADRIEQMGAIVSRCRATIWPESGAGVVAGLKSMLAAVQAAASQLASAASSAMGMGQAVLTQVTSSEHASTQIRERRNLDWAHTCTRR